MPNRLDFMFGVFLLTSTLIGCVNASGPAAQLRLDKMALWRNQSGPHLRGAVIYQRKYYEDLGDVALGGPPAGPPFEADDFTTLSAYGANAVVISHPGIFTESPPYTLDQELVNHLDNLLRMIEHADLFAVLAIRTGPGRSEFTFFSKEVGSWFGAEKLNDQIWSNRKAQDAWVAMWQFLANRYRNNPIIVGYELMVEPNSSDVGSDARSDRIAIEDPARFYRKYRGTSYDWNQLHPRIVSAIREVDSDTPILIAGNGYSSAKWLRYIEDSVKKRIVHVVHHYEPFLYTHQKATVHFPYPGWIDLKGNGHTRKFNSKLLKKLLKPVANAVRSDQVPIAMTELGTVRWAGGSELFLADTMTYLEQLGTNYFLYEWSPDYVPYTKDNNAFNFRLGQKSQNTSIKPHNKTIATISKFWHKNILRPSQLLQKSLAGDATTRSLPIKADEETSAAAELMNQDSEENSESYTIQTGSFLTIESARLHFDSITVLLEEIDSENLRIEKIEDLYAVRIGKYDNYFSAVDLLEKLIHKIDSAIILKAYMKESRIIELQSTQAQ